MDSKAEVATLGGGCFWCLEAVFEQLRGVHSVISGYCGGQSEHPTYRAVCEGATGHAEVVQVSFDPALISYDTLLNIFFAIHDPTTLNRQGNDFGTQYRSAIFYHSEQQRATAAAVIKDLAAEGLWDDPVVTEILPVPAFFPAEEYHQHYFSRNPGQGYCQIVVAPKVAKLRKSFSHLIGRNSDSDRA
ncbi:MAG: peptide-methionine (S)-S-oxide reductase MsrA [Betaproteobacteria bacterium]